MRSPQQKAARRAGATRDGSALGRSHRVYNGMSFAWTTWFAGTLAARGGAAPPVFGRLGARWVQWRQRQNG
ncbi:hypothetical protein RGQ21_75780 [Kitasatospora aureofaciens]|nr:hypothetical protein RGQ21_75780 [Kitasatospora aureofaciens]